MLMHRGSKKGSSVLLRRFLLIFEIFFLLKDNDNHDAESFEIFLCIRNSIVIFTFLLLLTEQTLKKKCFPFRKNEK